MGQSQDKRQKAQGKKGAAPHSDRATPSDAIAQRERGSRELNKPVVALYERRWLAL